MSWVTVIFSMTASACLTTALIYGFIWWRQRDSWAYLLFALAALAAAALAASDEAEMHAVSPAQFSSALRWGQLCAWVLILLLAGFVRLYFRAGRPWLFWSVYGLRTLSLILNFATGQNLNYRAITSLHRIPFLGESVAVAHGVPNRWMAVGQLGLLALIVFVVDAALTVWRRGERRQALIVGGNVVFFLLAASGQAVAVFWGFVEWPLMSSVFYLGIIAAMSYELGGEALRLARELRVRDQQMTLAAKAAKLGFWSRQFAGNEIWASDQWRDLLGFTKSEPVNLEDFFHRLHPDDREKTRRALTTANAPGGLYYAEYRVVLPDNRIRWVESQGRVELNHAQPVRLLGVSLDITQRKLAELEAQAHRNEAAHLLRAVSLGELSSALAHELKQPLSAILSNAQAAQLYLARDNFDLDEIRDILRDIVDDDKRARDVIDRLRALMKKSRFQPQPLEANELIRDVLRLMHHDLTGRGVQVVTELTPGLPAIRGDRVQLQQVLINLILNAGDAMSQPAQRRRTLTVRSARGEDSIVRISVADTGGGIPTGDEEAIFEAYHTTKPEGLGLGLSLSRSIVIAHGGHLWAENQVAGGAAFHCTIPEWKETEAITGELQ
jgi:two-component system sensor kinase FixL